MRRMTLTLAVVAMMATGTARADLITNGSFENPASLANPGWSVYQNISGWSTSLGAGIEIQENGIIPGVVAKHGTQYIELDSDTERGGTNNPTNSAATQLLTLDPGTYHLTWWYLPRTPADGGDRGANTNQIDVYFDKASDPLFTNLIQTVAKTRPPVNDWELQEYYVNVVTGGQYGLSFRAGGPQDEYGGFVDMVQLVRVPEPAALLLLGTALLGAGARLRRRV